MRRALMVSSLALAMIAPAAVAQFPGELYLGGGVQHNRLDGDWDNATGYQFFGGYLFPGVPGLMRFGGELGYRDSGDFSQSGVSDVVFEGVWASGVVRVPFTPSLSALGRVGWDFGDEDGLLYGAGIAYRMNVALSLRGEYVVRDETDSLQANVVIHF